MTNKKVFILTGNDHPAHPWEKTTSLLAEILHNECGLEPDIFYSTDEFAKKDLSVYAFGILNYCNWQDKNGISEQSKTRLLQFLQDNKGLMILHFSNGAFHFSLPNASESDWPAYRQICHAVWDHQSDSTHDDYGQMSVEKTDLNHYITENTTAFVTDDELYYNQKTHVYRAPILTAKSVKTGNSEPLAWAYTYQNSRIFQSLLGHNEHSYSNPSYQQILCRAAEWLSFSDKSGNAQ